MKQIRENKLIQLLNENKDMIKILFLIVLIYLVFTFAGIGCPIKYYTGVSCAGCGMTRAYIRLLNLDVKGAFSYHPLFALPPLVLILYINKKHITDSLYKAIMIFIAVAFVLVYLYRMIVIKDPIVVFEPQNGFPIRIIIALWRMAK